MKFQRLIFLLILFSAIFYLKLALSDYCQDNPPTCPNTQSSGCCKYPKLMNSSIMQKCKNRALAKVEGGRTVYYEDSCFLDCVFKAAGYPTTGNISGKFIKDALPTFEPGDPFSFNFWQTMIDLEMQDACNNKWKQAGITQKFTQIYRKALNAIDPTRPICNIQIAGFWDCIIYELMTWCMDPLFVRTPDCLSMSKRLEKGCFWW